MCRPKSDRHRLTIHVDQTGNYLLLCDDVVAQPVDVPGKVNRAGRLPHRLEPRLAAYGIKSNLITQEVLVWTGSSACAVQKRPEGQVDLSVIVVCTKYSRRLNQLVRSIVGQKDYDLSRAELVVAYVPGLDGTEDILECLATLWPPLGMVRVPFDEAYMHSKGFMINQAVTQANGRRVLITDADIVFPPDTFQRLESEFKDAHFVSVSGRKMLDAKTTAELLMGKRDPVADFAYLRDEAPGEMRLGEAKDTPIGYFQCVLRSHFRHVQYEELSHFEGADMRFSQSIRQTFGKETTIQDTVVLHQDHAGSRWFGTKRQF